MNDDDENLNLAIRNSLNTLANETQFRQNMEIAKGLSKQLDLSLSVIGEVFMDIGLQTHYKNKRVAILKQGFDHFE